MTFFNTNYSEVGSFELVPEGEYEVVISAVENTLSKETKVPMLKLTLTIRTDVDQPAQKRKMFDNLVASEKTMFKFQQIAKAVGFAEGMAINSIEDFGKQLKFKGVRIKVKHKENTYKNETKMKDEIAYYIEPKVPYGGGDPGQGSGVDPFMLPGMQDNLPHVPSGADAPPAPKANKTKKTKATDAPPWEDAGRPIDISEDDLPF